MKAIKIILLGCCVVSLLCCGQSEETRRRLSRAERAKLKTEDSLALKIAVLPTIDALPLFVAKECRLFDTLHVDVRLKAWKAQMDIDTALVGGSVEGGLTDLVRVERMQRRGTMFRCLATPLHWQLVTNRTARLKDASQLGDKMVAMTRFSATDLLTDHVLKGVKTKAMVYRVQINDVPLRLQMLMNNEMDALWLPEPQATVAREAHHPVLFDTSKKDIRLGALAFRSKCYDDARVKQQIDTFTKAYNMACDSLNSNGLQRYAEVIEKYCNVPSEIVAKLPKVQFPHAQEPRSQDVEMARKF